MDVNPYRCDIDKVLLKGELLIQVLEASVSVYPALEGRFPQVSNIEFTFDPSCPPGSRVIHNSVKVAGLPIIKTMKYSMVSTNYLTDGRDGYDVLKLAKKMVDPESCPDLGDLI
jgi:5'-nucleotidase